MTLRYEGNGLEKKLFNKNIGLRSFVRAHLTEDIRGDVYNSSLKTERALVSG